MLKKTVAGHQIDHLNDGRYGNDSSWVADSLKAWIQLEFKESMLIDRIFWSRDRQMLETTRTPIKYVIESSIDGKNWALVASSDQRTPFKEPSAGNKQPFDALPPIQSVINHSLESAYQVDRWHVSDGLPDGSIRAIEQTPDGFLWLGGEFGLARFDGSRFEIINPGNHDQPPMGPVSSLLVTSDGHLWVSSFSRQISVMVDGKFSTKEWNEGVIHRMQQGSDGRVWGASESGVISMTLNESKVTVMDGAESSRLLAVDREGLIYYGRYGAVRQWALGGAKVLMESGTGQYFTSAAIHPRSQGGIWLLDQKGQLRVSLPGALTTLGRELPFKIDLSSEYQLLEDQKQNLWFAVNNDAVYRVGMDGSCERFSLSGELEQGGGAQILFEDLDGHVWAGGHDCGLVRFRRSKIEIIRLGDQPSGAVSVVASSNGELFGLDRIGRSYRIHEGKGVPMNLPLSSLLAPVGQGKQFMISPLVWAEESIQLWGFDETKDPLKLADWSLYGQRMTAFDMTPNETVVFGLKNQLGIYQNGTFQYSSSPETSQIGRIKWVSFMQDNQYWVVGENRELYKFDGDTFSEPIRLDRHHPAPVSTLYPSKEEALWVGTLGQGLWWLSGDQVISLNATFGFPAKYIRAITGDGDGILWVAGNSGFYRIKLGTFDPHQSVDPTTLNWSFVEGAMGDRDALVTLDAQPNVHMARDGRAYFATSMGIAVLDPAVLSETGMTHSVLIESIEVNGDTVDHDHDQDALIQVNAEKNSVVIQIAAPFLYDKRHLQIQHRFTGSDNPWLDLNETRTLQYESLVEGEYKIQFRSKIAGGPWMDQPGSITIRSLAPFWATGHFGLILTGVCLVSLMGSGVYLYFRSLKHKLKAAQEMQTVDRERARIAADMHDRLGGRLTHLGLMARQLDADKENSLGRRIQQSVYESARNLDEIVWAVDPSKDTFESLIAYCMNLIDERAEDSEIRWHMETPDKANGLTVHATIRHELFLAISEAVNNVIKHAGASHAWLRIKLYQNSLLVEIEDNGKGMSPDRDRSILSQGNGLKSMRSRMARIGGKCDVTSKCDQGTKICYTLDGLREISSPKWGT